MQRKTLGVEVGLKVIYATCNSLMSVVFMNDGKEVMLKKNH